MEYDNKQRLENNQNLFDESPSRSLGKRITFKTIPSVSMCVTTLVLAYPNNLCGGFISDPNIINTLLMIEPIVKFSIFSQKKFVLVILQ